MTFPCRQCDSSLIVPDELTGQYMICPFCSGGNDIPDPPQIPYTGRPRDYGVGELRCQHCDYNLEALTDNRCPECGRRFTPWYLASLQQKRDALKGPIGISLVLLLIAALTLTCIAGLIIDSLRHW